MKIRRSTISTLSRSSAASDVYKRQTLAGSHSGPREDLEEGEVVAPEFEGLSDIFQVDLFATAEDRLGRKVPEKPLRERVNRVQGPAVAKLSLIHISEPTRLLSSSYAVFCLKKKNKNNPCPYTMPGLYAKPPEREHHHTHN